MRDNITFYLYDYSNVLVKRTKKIYSPYNVKTLGRVPTEDTYMTPDYVEFVGGMYELNEELVGKDRYDQINEWLGFYNPRGGILKFGKGPSIHLNGKRFKNDGIHMVRTEKIENVTSVKTETRIEKVNVQQIPLIIAETLNVKQLQELAEMWKIEISEDIKTNADAKLIKEKIIVLLKENGNISE